MTWTKIGGLKKLWILFDINDMTYADKKKEFLTNDTTSALRFNCAIHSMTHFLCEHLEYCQNKDKHRISIAVRKEINIIPCSNQYRTTQCCNNILLQWIESFNMDFAKTNNLDTYDRRFESFPLKALYSREVATLKLSIATMAD